jgi:hypothetical protein
VDAAVIAERIHTRIKPRHAWTNGFGERLQQTILMEHPLEARSQVALHARDERPPVRLEVEALGVLGETMNFQGVRRPPAASRGASPEGRHRAARR